MTTMCNGKGTKEQIGALEANLFHCRGCKNEVISLVLLTHVHCCYCFSRGRLVSQCIPSNEEAEEEDARSSPLRLGSSPLAMRVISIPTTTADVFLVENNAFHPRVGGCRGGGRVIMLELVLWGGCCSI